MSSGADGNEGNEPTNRRSESPTPSENETVSTLSTAHTNASNLIFVANRVDPGAKIAAVTKASDESTMIKIDPSVDSGTATTLATLAAMRLAYPFASIAATESCATGNTQFVVLLKTNTDDIRHAKQLYQELRSMRTLKAISNTLAVCGLCTYAALLYATSINIRQDTPL